MKDIKKIWTQLQESFWENEQIQQLRIKFFELEPKQQQIVINSTLASGAFLILFILFFSYYSCYVTKNKISEVNETISFLHRSADKMELLKGKIREQSSFGMGNKDFDIHTPLTTVIEKLCARSSIGKGSLEITNNRTTPLGKNTESSLELKLNKVSIKQIVRILFFIESAKNGISLQKVSLDERQDTAGFIWASIQVRKVEPALAANSGSSTLSSPFGSKGAKTNPFGK